jgi:hypothetical protein
VDVDWDAAMSVLDAWSGRDAVVVSFLAPGISLAPVHAPLSVDRSERGVVRLDVPGMPVALRRATFIEADWVPGQEERGLTVVQGGVRVDVFVDGE